jgi:WD40 repeat protein
MVVCGLGRKIRTRRGVSDGRELRSVKGHTDAVSSVVFGPDGSWVVSAGADNGIRIWEVGTGHEIRTMKGAVASIITATPFSGDGRSLASVDGVNGVQAMLPKAILGAVR